MKKLVAAVVVLIAIGVVAWLLIRPSRPPEVPFTKVRRETLISNIETNGKVQPVEWIAVRAARAGPVVRVFVEKGQQVAKGARIAALAADGAEAELAAAEARITQANAELDLYQRGGRASELVSIDNSLASARIELETARKNAATLERLVAKEAATRQELTLALDRARNAESDIASLDRKRDAIVSPTDRREAEARLREAQADAERAKTRIANSLIRSPMAGAVYDLAARPGAYAQAGDLLAEIGQLERLRVTVFVDEPELGRVRIGMPIVITWDALPGREWSGSVEKLPTQIVTLGTRQVGEVIGLIENEGLELPAAANINAQIRASVSESALTIPKEVLLREGDRMGVHLLEGNHVVWREIKLGASSVTRAEVLEGLADGDAVALPTEEALGDGQRVTPTFP